MGFFATFWNWLSAQLSGYIGTNTALLASALEPAVIALATLYVMAWGYLQLTGRIEEPFVAGLRRVILLAVVLGAALQLWLYNSVIVDTFYLAPTQLAAAVVGSATPVGTIDAIWQQGGLVAQQLWHNGGFLGTGFYVAGAFVWVLVGGLCVYTLFLISLASIASTVLLAVGPLFIVMLLFDATRKLFEAWLAQLLNYALVTILTVLVSSLLLHVVQSYATQTAARGVSLTIMDSLDMLLAVGLVLLVMRQILPIASGLAGGVALHGFSVVSAGLRWAAAQARAGVPAELAAQEPARTRFEPATPPTPSWRDAA